MRILAIVALCACAHFAETVPVTDSLGALPDSSIASPAPENSDAVSALAVPAPDFLRCPVSDSAYASLKQNNDNCMTALSVSMNAQMDAKKNAGRDPQAMMMSATSFVTGLGLGALLFWLIFGR